MNVLCTGTLQLPIVGFRDGDAGGGGSHAGRSVTGREGGRGEREGMEGGRERRGRERETETETETEKQTETDRQTDTGKETDTDKEGDLLSVSL